MVQTEQQQFYHILLFIMLLLSKVYGQGDTQDWKESPHHIRVHDCAVPEQIHLLTDKCMMPDKTSLRGINPEIKFISREMSIIKVFRMMYRAMKYTAVVISCAVAILVYGKTAAIAAFTNCVHNLRFATLLFPLHL